LRKSDCGIVMVVMFGCADNSTLETSAEEFVYKTDKRGEQAFTNNTRLHRNTRGSLESLYSRHIGNDSTLQHK
jgi:hypothetical protein